MKRALILFLLFFPGLLFAVDTTTGFDHGEGSGLADDDHTQYSLISSGAGAPATTPSRIGLIYVDTTAELAYISTGTTSSADWTLTQKPANLTEQSGAVSVNYGECLPCATSVGTCTVTAPTCSAANAYKEWCVFDADGNASTNNITVNAWLRNSVNDTASISIDGGRLTYQCVNTTIGDSKL